MPDGWYGPDSDAPTATTPTVANPTDTPRLERAATAAPEADYESAWASGSHQGSGVSGTKVKPVGAPDLALGESSAAAAARGTDKSAKRYKQMIVVAVFILFAALSAAVASVFIAGGDDQAADARIDESTGRDGEVATDDAGKPVPAQVAEAPTTTAPKSDGDKSDSSKSGGSSSSKSSSGSGGGATAPVPQAVGAAGDDLGIGPVNDAATVRLEGDKLVSDRASGPGNPNPIQISVGSTFTIKGDIDRAALEYPHLVGWDLAKNEMIGEDDGSVLALADSTDALYRFKAVGPGVVAFQMGVEGSFLLFVFVVV